MRDMSVTSLFLIQPSSCSLFLCLAAVDTGAWCMPTGTQTYTHSLTHLALLPAPTQACVPRPSTAYSFQHCSYTHTHSLPYLPNTHTHMLLPSPLPNFTSPVSQIQGTGLATKNQKKGLGLPYYLEGVGGSRSHQANLAWLYLLLRLAGPSLP